MKSIRETAEALATEHTGAAGYELERRKLLTNVIEQALHDERERCAEFAERARLPRGFQWGHDAMEQFDFGKERAAAAIREQAADPKYKP